MICVTQNAERAISQPPAPAPGHPAWWHALELGPVLTGAVFAAGAALAMIHAPAIAVIVVAFAVASSITIAAVIMARSGYGAGWTAAAACCGAGWAAYAAIAGPWSWPAITGLVVPAVILTPLWPAVRAHEAREAEAERRRLPALAAAEGARKWPAHLASIGFGIRLGGIYALQRLMQDSPRDQPTVTAVLCAFVRDQTSSAGKPKERPASQLPTDIQGVLTVVGTRNTANDGQTTVVEFAGAQLSGIPKVLLVTGGQPGAGPGQAVASIWPGERLRKAAGDPGSHRLLGRRFRALRRVVSGLCSRAGWM